MSLAITIAPAPAHSSFRNPLPICPTGCRTIVKSPVQGLALAVHYCIDCHAVYVTVPLPRWREYVRRPAVPVEVDRRILPFRVG